MEFEPFGVQYVMWMTALVYSTNGCPQKGYIQPMDVLWSEYTQACLIVLSYRLCRLCMLVHVVYISLILLNNNLHSCRFWFCIIGTSCTFPRPGFILNLQADFFFFWHPTPIQFITLWKLWWAVIVWMCRAQTHGSSIEQKYAVMTVSRNAELVCMHALFIHTLYAHSSRHNSVYQWYQYRNSMKINILDEYQCKNKR